jgi:tRNA dimethylallyltransferase
VARHLALVGPTASGKSAAALTVARQRPDVELVTVDSMQVYRGMDIGTAKPTPAEQAEVPHHLLDVADPDEEYSVARFQAAARAALDDIEGRGGLAVLVGGTGLYLDAVIGGLELPGQWPEVRAGLDTVLARAADPAIALRHLYDRLTSLDPVAAARIEPTNRRRIVRALEVTLGGGRPFSSYGPGLQEARVEGTDRRFFVAGIERERGDLAARISARYDAQLAAGFLDEVRALRARYGDSLSRTARQALGYRELLAHLDGVFPLPVAVAEAVRRTVRFAKRQERWFRRDPRITWYRMGPGDVNTELVVTGLLRDWESAAGTRPPV